MSEFKGTPGPWVIKKDSKTEVTSKEGELEICRTWIFDTSHIEADCNARLIAAAPDLLEALQLSKLGIEAMIEDGRCGETFVASALTLDTINTAIAKALGEDE